MDHRDTENTGTDPEKHNLQTKTLFIRGCSSRFVSVTYMSPWSIHAPIANPKSQIANSLRRHRSYTVFPGG
jgi:hypothetical protein